MFSRIVTALLLCLATTASFASAEPWQRNTFAAAEQAYKQGNLQSYQRLKERLAGYPLLPYLEYNELRDRIGSIAAAEVRRYLDTYPGTPTARRLRNAWLDRLASEGRWKEYPEYFDPDDSDVARRCNYLHAQILGGGKTGAFEAMPEIWLHGQSQPKACDWPLAQWRKAGHLTPELVRDRIVLAMKAGSLQLARYLQRLLPAADQPQVELWLKVDADPATRLPVVARGNTRDDNKRIFAHGVAKLAKTDPHLAFEIWNASRARFGLSDAEVCAVNERLAIALEDEPDAVAYRFFQDLKPCPATARLQEARVRAALLRQDWPSVASWIDALAEEQRKDERWQYWKARALEVMGQDKAARRLYQEAALERTYYGFLAADRIDAPYRYEHVAIRVDDQTLENVRRMPAMQRMQEFYALDRIVDARREWLILVPGLDRAQLLAASRIFDDWGWFDRAIFTSARAGYWDDLEMRFPVQHAAEVARFAGERNLDPSWVFGVLRQESAFMADARSSAGAIGLMQLMPATAQLVATRLGMAAPTSRALIDPETNIALGTGYLRMMLDDLSQDEVLATAAYNAGPHRVTRWRNGGTLPPDIWVELIPFKETRQYVQRVLAYAAIYDQRLGNSPLRLSERMRGAGTTG